MGFYDIRFVRYPNERNFWDAVGGGGRERGGPICKKIILRDLSKYPCWRSEEGAGRGTSYPGWVINLKGTKGYLGKVVILKVINIIPKRLGFFGGVGAVRGKWRGAV